MLEYKVDEISQKNKFKKINDRETLRQKIRRKIRKSEEQSKRITIQLIGVSEIENKENLPKVKHMILQIKIFLWVPSKTYKTDIP